MSLKLFSVDDHIIEPPSVWIDRLPARLRGVGPRVVEADGREFWTYEGRRHDSLGLNAVAGKPSSAWNEEPVRFADMIPGCYDPAARSKDMRADGIVGSVLFPSLPGFGGRVFLGFKDKDLANLCVRAYNDFVMDEWCAADPALFVPTIICQLWDPDLAAAEIRRCAAKGARTIAFPENTSPLNLPSVHNEHWDPVWHAITETGMVVSMHGGSSGRMPLATPDSHFAMALVGCAAMFSIEVVSDLLLSPLPRRFPQLKFVITEGGVGWAPYLLERADMEWKIHRHWWGLKERPSEVFAKHIWLCLVGERFAVEQRHKVGVDKILWECDYPHAETPWPHSQTSAAEQFAGVDDDEVAAMTYGNAAALFRWNVDGPCS